MNHWPSRAAASPARERAGEQVRALKDSLLNEDSNAKVIIKIVSSGILYTVKNAVCVSGGLNRV